MRKVVLVKDPGEKEIRVNYAKDGRKSEFSVLIIAVGDNKYRLKLAIHHTASNTSGRAVVKGIVKDCARVDVEGLVKVAKSLEHVESYLEIKLLLVGEEAQGFAEPGLEIESNEVSVGHSVTIGRIRDEEILCLQSRGIEEERAKGMLIHGFLREELELLSPENKVTILSKLGNTGKSANNRDHPYFRDDPY